MAEYIIKINDNDEADSDGGKRVEEIHRLVRCKDCKHKPVKGDLGIEFPDYKCPCQNSDDDWYSYMPDDDWFCAEGEPKEGGTE